MKKIAIVLLAALMLSLLSGCYSLYRSTDTERDTEIVKEDEIVTLTPKEELEHYMSYGLEKIGGLETEMLESYRSVAGENYTSDPAMYEELCKTTLPLCEDLLEMVNKYPIKDEKLAEVHGVYIAFIEETKKAYDTLIEALKEQDLNKASQTNTYFQSANGMSADFRLKLSALCAEYGVPFGSGAETVEEKQEALIDYYNNILMELDALDEEIFEIYMDITDRDVEADVMYQAMAEELFPLARSWSDKSNSYVEVLAFEELRSVHTVYVQYVSQMLNYYNAVRTVLLEGEGSSDMEAEYNKADGLYMDYLTKLEELLLKYEWIEAE